MESWKERLSSSQIQKEVQKISPLHSSDSGLGAAWILRRYEGAMVRPTLTPFHYVSSVLLFSGARPDCAQRKSGRQSFPRTSRLQKGAPVLSYTNSLCSIPTRGGYHTLFLAHMGLEGMPNAARSIGQNIATKEQVETEGHVWRESLLDIVICVLCVYAI